MRMVEELVDEGLAEFELAPWQRACLEGFLGGGPFLEPQRATVRDRELVVELAVVDRVGPVMRHIAAQLRQADRPLAHFYVDEHGGVQSLVDELALWERSNRNDSRFGIENEFELEAARRRWLEAYAGDLRDEFGERVDEREPSPCGWHQRDGYRMSGAAADVEPLPPVEGGWPLW